jgi:signal transduction histidine kinase
VQERSSFGARGKSSLRRFAFSDLAEQDTSAGLLRQFAVLSFVVIALITLVLSLVISHYLRKNLLEREWRTTADYVTAEARFHLIPSDFTEPFTPQAVERFRTLYRETATMPEIVRMKVYDASMTLIWSDEPRLIGRRFPENQDLARALHGRITAGLGVEGKGYTILDRNLDEVLELYVPVMLPGSTRVIGVIETYKVPAEVFANIRHGQLVVGGTALAGGVVLYLSLFWIVRRAARHIERQRALTARVQAAREQERSSVAHEAREELAQVLSALKVDLAWMVGNTPNQDGAQHARLCDMLALVATAMKSALQIASDSRPAALDQLGLGATLDLEAQRFQARTGIRCELTSNTGDLDLDPQRRTVLFRIFQEAMSNVEHHADATRVAVTLHQTGDSVVLAVQDDGRGITEREITDRKSLGILGMRESAHVVRGKIRITGAPGGGTTVTVTVPLGGSDVVATQPVRVANSPSA